MRIGAHVRGGVQGGVEHALEIGAKTIQIFAGSPQTWRAPSHSEAAVAAFREGVAAHDLAPVFLHGVYVANLASPKPATFHMSVSAVASHLVWANKLDAAGLIIHPGSAGADPLEAALERVVKGVRRVLEQVEGPAQLLLECCAGQGATIGRRFAELQYVIDALGGDPRLGWVLDTCHVFNAGYDLTTEAGFQAMVAEIEATVGFARLKAVHANDSKTPLGAQVDRHENIGEGYIGDEAFARLLRHPAFTALPIILEVPGYDRKGPDRPNIERLCRLAGVPVPPARQLP
ncbi:MAG TPA: deoxyribonuclease IV [Chloroflexota bacterium]|nr:deoxyribonuclease IV [Chloroflexota bacterium]